MVNNTGDVLGISGLYEYQDDDPDTVWLGWSVVEKNVQHHGIFSKIAKQLRENARNEGKKWIKLYTSTDEHEVAAQAAYGKLHYDQLQPGDAGYPSQAILEKITQPYQGNEEQIIIIRGLQLD